MPQRTQFKLKKLTAPLFAASALLPLLIPPGALGVTAAFVPLGGPLWNGLYGYCPYELSATITQTNNELTVSWPGANLYNWVLSTTNAVLQASSDLTANSAWTNVAAQKSADGDTVAVTVAGTNEAQFFRVDASPCCTIPIFQFAIFYNDLLEFTGTSPWTIRGRVHANSDILTGSSQPLTFYDTVTTTGSAIKKAWAGYPLAGMTEVVYYDGNPGLFTNVPSMTLPIGTTNTPAAIREIINLPPAGESMYSPLGTNRYFNKAEMTLLVSNTIVTAQIRSVGGFDPSPAVISWPTNKLPYFLSVTNAFTDRRETKLIKTTQIDIGKYNVWALTNATVASKLTVNGTVYVPNVLYVADFRTASSSMMYGVRLTNGAALPWRGLTVATPDPLYTIGNYNCPANFLNTTNTTQTKPASLVSDALTILSGAWKDADSANSLSTRDPVNTTVNAAIMTGIVYSDPVDGNPYSGGVMNLPRLLEDWDAGQKRLTLNTAIVNLFDSRYATNQWQTSGVYYTVPIRDFNFDLNFSNPAKLPPGTPLVRIVPPGN